MAAAVMARGNSRAAGDAGAEGVALTIARALTLIMADSVNSRANATGSFDFKLHHFT
jgi:hypothetical protein